MGKLFKTQKEKDEHIYKMLGINKWYKWKIRLGRRLNNTIMMLLLWYFVKGVAQDSCEQIIITVISLLIFETIMAILIHIYYLIKWKIKKMRRR